uniref:Uncharacterized protein n=1 Tax=Mus spicilegus TaxID=10103 RepID=A0A8C6G8A4_MUSSI
MATTSAAGRPEEPLSPKELLPKAKTQKTEGELEEDKAGEFFQGNSVDWDHFLHDPGSLCCLLRQKRCKWSNNSNSRYF